MNQSTNIKLTAEISATSKGLVDALKQASSAVNSTSESWKSRFDKLKDSTSTISQGVKNLSDLVKQVGNVNMSVDGVDKIKDNINDLISNFDKVQGEVNNFAQSLAQMKVVASDLGMPIEEYQRFAEAVRNAGIPLEEAQNAIRAMQRNIQGFSNGVPEAEAVFQRLGLTIEKLSSNTATANFDEVIRAMQNTIPPTEQAKASMDMFSVSMEHAVNISQEYTKLLVTQKDNAYATDKDVQSAISLSTAVGKLGEQLGTYLAVANNASNVNGSLSKSALDLFDQLKGQENVLNSLLITYANYVDSLKQGATSTLDASSALRALKAQVEGLASEGALAFIGSKPLEDKEEFTKKLSNLVTFLSSAKDKIKEEMEAVRTIIEQRLDAGAPVDVKEIQVALEHLKMLKTTINGIDTSKTLAGLNISEDAKNSLKELTNYIEKASKKMSELNLQANDKNLPLMFNEAKTLLKEFTKQLEEAQQKFRHGEITKIDFSKIDSFLAKVKNHVFLVTDKSKELVSKTQDLITGLSSARKEASDFQTQMEKGVSIFAPLVKLFDRFKTSLRELKSTAKDAFKEGKGGSEGFLSNMLGAWNAIKACALEMSHVKKNTDEATSSGKNLNSELKQAAGQMLGLGSKVAVIVKGVKALGNMIMSHIVDPWRKANEEARKMQEWMTEGQIKTAEANIERFENMESDLRKYAELMEKARNDRKESDRVKAQLQGYKISRQYGLDVWQFNPWFDDDGSKTEALLKEGFGMSRNGMISAIETQIDALKKLNEALDKEYAEVNSYFKTDLWEGTDTAAKNRNKERLAEINKEKGANLDRIGSLTEKLNIVKGEDPLWEMRLEANARKQDEENAKEEEEKKKTKKAEEEQAKALEEAYKELTEWANSLTDNDRQKNLREIMERFFEAVNNGVNYYQARNVAVMAITKMLENEREEEDKKNKELLKALEQHIEAYKKAYKDYIDAEKKIKDAKKNYADTQKELANENKKEVISRRRERVQKQMSRFGFSLYEGFRMDEKSSERRERRRNIQLDSSIAEKMTKAQAGDRVHFTHAEKERIKALEKLQKKDKQLEASQMAMEAAENQKNAAKKLEEAARAIKEAVYGRDVAKEELGKSEKKMNEASSKRMKRSVNDTPEMIFERSTKSLYARGVIGASSTRQLDYSLQFQQLHTDLQSIMKNTYLVK